MPVVAHPYESIEATIEQDPEALDDFRKDDPFLGNQEQLNLVSIPIEHSSIFTINVCDLIRFETNFRHFSLWCFKNGKLAL